MKLFFLMIFMYIINYSVAQCISFDKLSEIEQKRDSLIGLKYSEAVTYTDSFGLSISYEFEVLQYLDTSISRSPLFRVQSIGIELHNLLIVYNGNATYVLKTDTTYGLKINKSTPVTDIIPSLYQVLSIPYSQYNTGLSYDILGIFNKFIVEDCQISLGTNVAQIKTAATNDTLFNIERRYELKLDEKELIGYSICFTSPNGNKENIEIKITDLVFNPSISSNDFTIDESNYSLEISD